MDTELDRKFVTPCVSTVGRIDGGVKLKIAIIDNSTEICSINFFIGIKFWLDLLEAKIQKKY